MSTVDGKASSCGRRTVGKSQHWHRRAFPAPKISHYQVSSLKLQWNSGETYVLKVSGIKKTNTRHWYLTLKLKSFQCHWYRVRSCWLVYLVLTPTAQSYQVSASVIRAGEVLPACEPWGNWRGRNQEECWGIKTWHAAHCVQLQDQNIQLYMPNKSSPCESGREGWLWLQVPGALNNLRRQGAPLLSWGLQGSPVWHLPPKLDNVHSRQESLLSLRLPDLLAPGAQPWHRGAFVSVITFSVLEIVCLELYLQVQLE